ncbi:SAM-dependent methyltransferase [Micromonospora sp. WMMD736]|uniref:SAM-dependent methyltransferase n=1 Tax=Micromonospora sp. WMMD736 TaxID=3404112 RepID=UPI003B963C4B
MSRGAAGSTTRGVSETLRFFAGYDLVEPGLVETTRWRPDGESEVVESHGYAGVGVRR